MAKTFIANRMLAIILMFTALSSFAQVQVKKNNVVVCKKKGVEISYTYQPVQRETQGNWLTDNIEFELSFLIHNTTTDSVKLDSKILFETNYHPTTIALKESLAAGES